MRNAITTDSPNYSAPLPAATQSAEDMIFQALSGEGQQSPADQLTTMMQLFQSLLPADAKALYDRLKLRNDQDPLSAEFHKAFNGEPLRNLREALEAKFKEPASSSQQSAAAPMNQNANPRATGARRAEVGMTGNYIQSQLLNQTTSAAPATTSAMPAAQAGPTTHQAMSVRQSMASNVQQLEDLGARITNSKEPATEADRNEWMQAQQNLRQSVINYAGEISKLPPDSPDRVAAQAEMNRLSEKLTANELPVLARFDKGFGESWNHFHDKTPGSEGAVLSTRMKMYGITDEQMQRYVATGQEPDGLKKAVHNARQAGDWPALGVVRASYQMRADYLRATTKPEDTASRKQADQLDAAASGLTNNRNAIQVNWGADKYSKLSQKYPDETTRPANVQKQMDEAKQAVASVRSRAVDQVTAHPERYGKNSPTRKLAGDALTTEARMTESEAKVKMEKEAKANVETTDAQNKALKPDQQKVVPPPPKLHPDLAEGGAVDQKRAEAVKIDPSLGDVVHGGDRALQFHRDTTNTKKLRLNINEQQVAHLTSKGQQPSAELVAKTNTQVEDIFKNTLETHDKLTRQKPGSLSVDQTKLLAELGGDATTYSAKLSNIAHQKTQIEMDSRLKNQSQYAIQHGRDELDKAYGDFDKAKLDRVKTEMQTKMAMGKVGFKEMQEFQENPAAFAKKQPDSAEEAKFRSDLDTAKAEGDKLLASAKTNATKAQQQLDYSKKIDDLDGLNTDPDMATGLAKDALARSDAHMKAIPASGPERLPRLQAAADHQSAKIGLSTVIRDNADARIARTALSHSEVEIAHGNHEGEIVIDDPVAKSADYLAKVTAEETDIKRGAFKDAKSAVVEADQLRKDIGTEIDKAQAKLPKAVQAQRAGDVQAYKDTLAMQQVRTHGVVAQLGADIDPNGAREQLETGSRIIKEEMPYTHVSRTNKAQAAMEHSRNEIRAQALADHGDASLVVAQRAQFTGGTEYGMLVVDALSTAHRSAGDLKETLTIDGGGAAGNTANKKLHEELTKRADATVKDALEIDKSADVLKLADSIDKELAKDVDEFHKLQGDLSKAMKDQRGDAFGIFANTVSRIRGAIDGKGGDLNKIGLEVGNEYLNLGSWKGRAQASGLRRTADTIREMHAAGIPNHVIMASLRDPRFTQLHSKFSDQNTFEQTKAESKKLYDEIEGQIKGRFGVALPENFMGAAYGIRDTGLGKVMDNARSNRTDNIVTYLGHKNTDLLKEGKAELREYADMANRDWKKVAPYAAASQVVDQVVITMASGAALAGVFARAASLTRIPQAFAAARGVAVGMSAPARLAVLAGINASEAGLGMLTGAAMGKVGEGIFGEGSTGAKIFGAVGGGFQLSNASKVAMRSGLAFQAAMGLTLGGVPIVAQQLGASSDLAEKIGTASGIFLPTVMGTMSNRNTIKRAEHVMVNELGLDPTKARGLMGDLFHAESTMDPRFVKNGAFDVEGFTRERAGKLVDAKFPGLNENARTTILDNASLDAARRRIEFDPPKNGSVKDQVHYVDEFHGRLESELVKMGVKADRARELAQSEKTAMYDQALAATNARGRGEEGGVPEGGAPNTPQGAGASTRHMIDQVMRGTERPLPDVHLLNGKTPDLPLKLLAMDNANDRAYVKYPDGSIQSVNARDVVYVHDAQTLGNLPPAVQKRFHERVGQLGDDQKTQFNNMMEAAQKKSPEHVAVLRKMLAGGASMDEIHEIHQRTLDIPQAELGKFFSPGNLPQHLEKACAAACIQQTEGFFYPQKGEQLRDPAFQKQEQIDIMKRQDGGAKQRTDKVYPLDAPPLRDQQWVPARENPYAGVPNDLTNALKQHPDYHKFDVAMQLDRRYLGQHLTDIASNGTAYVHGHGPGGKKVVYELSETRTGPNGDEIKVRIPGDQKETWWKKSDLNPDGNGNIYLPDGTMLTHVAVPPDRPLKAADNGVSLDQDRDMQNKIRAATGKGITRHEVKDGDAALRAIHDSVKDIGIAGAVVKWKDSPVQHQLLIKGARDLGGGNYSFDVFEPWTGKTKTVSGEELKSHYKTSTASKSEGELKFVQLADDIKLAGTASSVSRAEMQARNQIELHEPQKLNTLAEIDRLPEQQRSVLVQMLRHEGNPDEMATVLRNNFDDVANLDAQTQQSLVNLYRANPSVEAKAALMQLIPTLAQMPEGARNYAMERLESMMPQDVQRTAQRLQDATKPNFDRRDENFAMQFARQIFGG